MTRVEREELLRRYLEGEMSLEQEHDFIIQVALDKELRHELKAQQTIDRAFRKDRVVDPSAYASLQSAVSAMIAAPAATAEPASVVAGTASIYARFLGKGVQRWTIGGIAGLALLGGALLFGLPDGDELAPAARQEVLPEHPNVYTVPAAPEPLDRPDGISQAHGAPPQSVAADLSEKTAVQDRSENRPRVVASAASASSSRRMGRSRSDSVIQGNGEDARNGSAIEHDSRNADIGRSVDSVAVQAAESPNEEDSIGIGVRLLWKK